MRCRNLWFILFSIISTCFSVRGADAIIEPPICQGLAAAVAFDGAGNRYVAGGFNGTRDFNPGVGIDSHSTSGGEEIYVTKVLADGRRVRCGQVIHRPLVRVEPRDVAGRDLQVEKAHRSALEHLPVVRLLVHRHDRCLPGSGRVGWLPHPLPRGNRNGTRHRSAYGDQ